MKILGIDPGLRTTGFGLIEKQGQKISYLASGTIKTADASLPERIKTIFSGVTEIIDTYQPDCASVEIVFVNVNPQSTLLLGQARGAAICALVNANLSVAEYTALQVKQGVVGHGKAKKEQVQEMVQRLLNLPALPGPDAADALGVAICHAHSGDALSTLSNLAPGLAKRGFRVKGGRLIG
jgi:crossover junction endodeoxyribonuclease RuvC